MKGEEDGGSLAPQSGQTAGLLATFARVWAAAEDAAAGRYAAVFPDLFWVTGYAAVILAAAILVFRLKMKSEKL